MLKGPKKLKDPRAFKRKQRATGLDNAKTGLHENKRRDDQRNA
jgi:hypothetical protein